MDIYIGPKVWFQWSVCLCSHMQGRSAKGPHKRLSPCTTDISDGSEGRSLLDPPLVPVQWFMDPTRRDVVALCGSHLLGAPDPLVSVHSRDPTAADAARPPGAWSTQWTLQVVQGTSCVTHFSCVDPASWARN